VKCCAKPLLSGKDLVLADQFYHKNVAAGFSLRTHRLESLCRQVKTSAKI
jgi:hypothetical protein